MNNFILITGSLIVGGVARATGQFLGQIGNAAKGLAQNVLRNPVVNQAAQAAREFIDDGPVIDVLNNNVLNNANNAVPAIIPKEPIGLVAHP